MFVAGFQSGSLCHKNCYENKISIPSLHVYGTSDDIINRDMSERLQECFVNPISVTHAGGHFFPASNNEKPQYVDFFRNQLQSYLEAKELKLNGLAIGDEDDEEKISS